MNAFNGQDATSALNLLSEVSLRRDEEIGNYNTHPDRESSDDEQDSPCPYFDQFFDQGGNGAIRDMSNFSPREFELLWILLETFIKSNCNSGRGKKCHVSGKDMLFMLLVVLKHGGQ